MCNARGNAYGHDRGNARGNAYGHDRGNARGNAYGHDNDNGRGNAYGHDRGNAYGRCTFISLFVTQFAFTDASTCRFVRTNSST